MGVILRSLYGWRLEARRERIFDWLKVRLALEQFLLTFQNLPIEDSSSLDLPVCDVGGPFCSSCSCS